MKITDTIGKTLSLSFEVFPPKTESSFASVETAAEEIAKLQPAFMSVTYGAGGGTSRYTLDIAQNIQKLYGVPTLAHLTCVSSTKESVRRKIGEIKALGIQNVMAKQRPRPLGLSIRHRSCPGAAACGWQFLHRRRLLSRDPPGKRESGGGHPASPGKSGRGL